MKCCSRRIIDVVDIDKVLNNAEQGPSRNVLVDQVVRAFLVSAAPTVLLPHAGGRTIRSGGGRAVPSPIRKRRTHTENVAHRLESLIPTDHALRIITTSIGTRSVGRAVALLVGLDVGTSSAKAVVFTHQGEVMAKGRVSTPVTTSVRVSILPPRSCSRPR